MNFPALFPIGIFISILIAICSCLFYIAIRANPTHEQNEYDRVYREEIERIDMV